MWVNSATEKSRLGQLPSFRIAKVAQADRQPGETAVRAEATRCSSDTAIFVSSSQEARWRTWRVAASENLEFVVFSFSTTVRAIRDSLREAVHVCCASCRIIGSVSASKTSCSKVSSTDMGLCRPVRDYLLSSIPRANS